MTFIGRIKRGSAIWNMWKAHKRVGGGVANVHFQITHGGDFETIELNADQVIELQKSPSVELIATGKLPDVPVYVFTEETPEPTTSQEVTTQITPTVPRPRGRPPKQPLPSPFAAG